MNHLTKSPRRGAMLPAVIIASAVLLGTVGCAQTGPEPAEDGAKPVSPVTLAYAGSSPIPTLVTSDARDVWSDKSLDVTLETVGDVGLATGLVVGQQAEFGHSAPTTALQAIGKGVPITIISGLGFGQGEHQAGYLSAPASSGIESLGDLAGKRVAVTGLGTSYDFYLRARLAEEGLEVGGDVQLVPVPYPQMLGALNSGEVDAAVLLAVDYARLSAQEPVNVISTTSELAGSEIEYSSCIIVRNDWLAENEDVAVDFLAGLLEAEMFLSEDIASGATETKALLQPLLKYDDATWDMYFPLRLEDIGSETDFVNMLGMPQVFVDSAIDTLKLGGGLETVQEVTYENSVDLSYLKKAYEQLGIEWNDSPKYK